MHAGVQARFVVMGNVFPTDVRLHRRYDLKGSTLGRTSARKAGDPNTVLKVTLIHPVPHQSIHVMYSTAAATSCTNLSPLLSCIKKLVSLSIQLKHLVM